MNDEIDKLIYKHRVFKENSENVIFGFRKYKPFPSTKSNYEANYISPKEHSIVNIEDSNQTKDNSNNNQNLRFSYSNINQFKSTNKSLHLPQGTNVYIPKNHSNDYLKLSIKDNQNSILKDFFILNKKTLLAENFRNHIPGFSGHVSKEIVNFKGKERKFCLTNRYD